VIPSATKDKALHARVRGGVRLVLAPRISTGMALVIIMKGNTSRATSHWKPESGHNWKSPAGDSQALPRISKIPSTSNMQRYQVLDLPVEAAVRPDAPAGKGYSG
jgi:hypothetical protein